VTSLLDSLTRVVASKLRTLGFSSPRLSLIHALLDRAYLASLRTEEGRFVRGSVTFADPRNPDVDPPILRRASYPAFTAFTDRMRLTPELLVKLSRAIDQWSGSIAVYGTTPSDLVAWGVVDQIVHANVRRTVPARLLREFSFAEEDSQDRDLELTGAARLVTSLASIDGLVLLTPSLGVVGFGVKIRSGPSVGRVYDGTDLTRRGTRAKTIDPSRFGTRHGSILRYCRADSRALGVIVSQDGQVRLVMTAKQRLALWGSVQLLDYEHDVRRYAVDSRRRRAFRSRRRAEARLGYSPMPKTLKQLSQLKVR